jgi:WbqC-like protein family
MRVAIMQPTYLPWLGYFDMMARVDTFVLLDNVQFEKKSWQQRNRIKTSQGELLLTVPVLSAGRFDQLIADTDIDVASRFATKHVKSIRAAYAKAPHLDDHLPELAELIESGEPSLATFNESVIRWMAKQLGVTTRIIRGTELTAEGRGTELTVAQLLELGATSFLAAAGSRPYVSAEPAFAEHGIDVEFHEYVHPEYPQLHGSFLPYLAAVDALLNVGADAARRLIADDSQTAR